MDNERFLYFQVSKGFVVVFIHYGFVRVLVLEESCQLGEGEVVGNFAVGFHFLLYETEILFCSLEVLSSVEKFADNRVCYFLVKN